MTFSADDARIEAFFELAADASYDIRQYPNTHHLQDFIQTNVLPEGPKEAQIPHFVSFAKQVVCRCNEQAALCDTFQAVMQCMPKDAPDQKRIEHALDKVGKKLDLLKPIL